MINKLRVRAQSDSGFTLVELLVVMLILGLLAAIAIPSFFNQRDKARDADAKTQARTAQTAIETYATDNDGEYNSSGAGAVTATDLVNIEATLGDLPAGALTISTPTGTGPPADNADNSYTVTVDSTTGNDFSVTRHGDGTTDNTCNNGGDAGCPTNEEWD
jgi:type IV pilus assembly protein PilA